jgi:hypothetical protein
MRLFRMVKMALAWALYKVGSLLLIAGDRTMLASEYVQGELPGPWL